MDIFLFCLTRLSVAAEGLLHIFFVGRFTKKKPKPRYYLFYLFSLAVIDGAALAAQAGHFTVFWELLPLYLISRFALENRRADSCVAAVLAVYVAQLCGGLTNAIEILFFPKTVNAPLLYLWTVLATLAALVLIGCCYLLVLRWFPLAEGREAWILLPSGLFLLAAELYILQTSYSVVDSDSIDAGKEAALLVLQLLSLTTLLSALYAWQRICRGFQAQAAVALLKQETQAQKTYVAEAGTRYEQTQSFRHDIKNHLSVLDGLLKSGRARQAERYLQKLETTVKALSFSSQTGNPVVDILLADKCALAGQQGIQTEISLALPRSGQVDDLDWCILFSNALDNALQAHSSWLRVTGKRQGDFYLLVFENACLSQPRPEIGTGLSNIKAVAEKYGGQMEIEIETAERGFVFRLHILLNACGISIHSEGCSGQKPCNPQKEV